MAIAKNKEQTEPAIKELISKDVTDASLDYLETKLIDQQQTAEELVSLGTNVSTEQLFAKEILGKEKTRSEMIERFSPPQIGTTTLEQIENNTDTEMQAELAALLSGGIGFTVIGRLRKGVIDTSGHNLDAGPFPPETIQKIIQKAQTLGINNIQSTTQLRTIGQTMGIDLTSQEPFLRFLEQETPLSKELRETYLGQISSKMEVCMEQFLASYTPTEKKETKRGTISQLIPTKKDLQRKDNNGNRDRDNVKSFMGKTAVIGGAAVAVVKGIKRLFGVGGSKKDQPKKEKGWFGRTMDKVRNVLMIGGAATVGHRLITGEWFWGTDDEVDAGGAGSIPGNKEANDYFKEFSPEQRAAYDATARAINEMYTTHAGVGPAGSMLDTDMLGESSFEHTDDGQEATGLLIAMLDKRYSSVSELTANSTIYNEIYGNKIKEKIDRLRDKSKEAVISLFAGAASLIGMNSLVTKALGLTSKEDAKKFMEEHPEITKKFPEALRKYLKIIGYFGYKKKQLPRSIARQHLITTDTTFVSLSPEEQDEKIDDLLEDSSFVTEKVDPVLKAYKTAPISTKNGTIGAIQLLQQQQLLDGKLIPADQQRIEQITKEHQELIHQDEEGNCFDLMREHLQTGNQLLAKQQLQELHGRLEEHLAGEGRSSRRSAYLPLLAFFDTEAQMKKHLFQDLDIGGTGKKYLDMLDSLSKKNTLTEADIIKAEQTVKDYHALIKELSVTDISIQNITKENGQVFIDIGHTIRQHGESIITGIRLIWSEKDRHDNFSGSVGDLLKGGAMLGGTAASAALVTYPARLVLHPINGIRQKFNLRPRPKLPTPGPARHIGKAVTLGTARNIADRTLPHGMIHRYAVMGRYKHAPQLLWVDLANGRLSPDEAQKIAFRYNEKPGFNLHGHAIKDVNDLFKRAFNIHDQAQINFLKDNRNTPITKSLIGKGKYKKGRNLIGRLHRGNYEPIIDTGKLHRYIQIDQQISLKPTVQKTLFKNIFQHSTNETFVAKLLAEPFPRQLEPHLTSNRISIDQVAKIRAKYGAKAQLPAGKTHLGFLDEIVTYGLKNGKITNTETFMNNLVRRRPSITANARSGKEAFERIEKRLRLDMNATKLERAWKASKELLTNVISQFKKVQKNPRLTHAYKKTVGELIEQSTKALHHLTPATMNSVKQRIAAGKVGRIPQGVTSLTQAFRGSKSLRLLGSVVGKILIVGGIGFSGYDTFTTHKEADAYTATSNNEKRGKAWKQEANIKTGILVAETASVTARGASALFSAAAGANAVPFAGQIASAVLVAAGVGYLGVEYYFDTKKERLKNQEDFFHEAADIKLATKQNVIAVAAYKAGQTRSFKQSFHNICSGKYFGTIAQKMQKEVSSIIERERYIKQGIEALIAVDELENNTTLRNSFIQNGGGLANGERPKDLKERINKRYTALTNLYGTPPINGTDTEHHTGITTLSRRIHASRRFSSETNDDTPTSRESREKEITQDARYSTLLQHFETNHSDLVHYRHNSEQIQGWIMLEENSGVMKDNLRYFEEFMAYQKYLYRGAPTRQDVGTAKKQIFSFPDTPRPINEQTVDMQQVVGFFSNREKKPTTAASVSYLTPQEIEKERHVSPRIGQQVLYRLCNEIFGYTGPNMLREDAAGKQGGILSFLQERSNPSNHPNEFITGIYYDKAKNVLKLNKTGMLSRDHIICAATPEALSNVDNVKKLAQLFDNTNIFETKKRFGEKTINKELTDHAKRIIHEELRRRSDEGQQKINNDIQQFYKTHGNDVLLPIELQINLIRSSSNEKKYV